jgi:hypothetical protein
MKKGMAATISQALAAHVRLIRDRRHYPEASLPFPNHIEPGSPSVGDARNACRLVAPKRGTRRSWESQTRTARPTPLAPIMRSSPLDQHRVAVLNFSIVRQVKEAGQEATPILKPKSSSIT